MSQFSSGKRDKVHGDPWPYVWEKHSPRDQMRADTDMFRKGAPRNWNDYASRPRPEFDRPLTNPANPILAAFRDYLGRTPFQMPRTLAHLFLRDYANGGGHIVWRIANTLEIEHAQRVLTRLANLTKDES